MRARARVRGKRIVVEEKFLHFRELRLHLRDFLVDALGTACAIAMSLRYLRPQAKRAFCGATAACIQRDVWILTVRAVVFQVIEILFVDFGDERQRVQLLAGQNRTIRVVMNRSVAPVADTADFLPIRPPCDFDHRMIEFLAPGDIDGGGNLEYLFGARGRMTSDERDDAIGIRGLDGFGGPGIHPQRWRRSVYHHEIVILCLVNGLLNGVVMRRGIE